MDYSYLEIDRAMKIGGIPHRVTLLPDSRTVDHSRDAATNLLGQIDYGRSSINLYSSAPEERILRTFWHEVLHGIIDSLKIRELMPPATKDPEIPIDQLSIGIAEVLDTMSDEMLRVFGLKRIDPHNP